MMNDTSDKKPPARKPLTLSTSGRGSVRQSLSGGRSKAVVVEKKKKVIIRPGKGSPAGEAAPSIKLPDAPKIKIDAGRRSGEKAWFVQS